MKKKQLLPSSSDTPSQTQRVKEQTNWLDRVSLAIVKIIHAIKGKKTIQIKRELTTKDGIVKTEFTYKKDH